MAPTATNGTNGTTVRQPSINSQVYEAIKPENFVGALKGKVVIITGAGGVLGRGESVAFAKAGATLALLDIPRAEAGLQQTISECEAEGAKAKGYYCNVTDEKASAETLAKIESELGPVDVLLNNAGGSIDRPLHMETFEQFWSMIDLNFKAPMLWIHMLINKFRERKRGTIISIASRAGTVSIPFGINYAAAKGALIRATSCLQLELDMDGFEDIHCFALHPGATNTGIQKPIAPDVAARYPGFADVYVKFCKLFCCTPALCGQTCVFLATGKAKALKGRYFDCEQDIGYVSTMGEEIQAKDLYSLKTEFLGGLPNDGGTVKDDALSDKELEKV